MKTIKELIYKKERQRYKMRELKNLIRQTAVIKSDKITAHNKKIREYKEGLNMILKWGGSSEEKMSAAIQLIEELITDLDNLEA